MLIEWDPAHFKIGWAISQQADWEIPRSGQQLNYTRYKILCLVGSGGVPIKGDPRLRSAAMALNDPSNELLLFLELYTEERNQHWSLQSVK